MYPVLKVVLTLTLFVLIVYFSSSYATSDNYAIFASKVSELRDDLGYAISLLAWFFLDLLPYLYMRILSFAAAVSQLTRQDVADWIIYLVIVCPVYAICSTVGAIYNAFQCPRQETFLFFWSYPQSYYCAWYNAHYGRSRTLSALDMTIVIITTALVALTSSLVYARYLFDTRARRTMESAATAWSLFYYGEPYKHALAPMACRNSLHNTPMPEAVPQPNHSHGESAAHRLCANAFMRSVATALLHVPWSYQMSSADQRSGVLGSRDFFWVKDLSSVPCNDPLPDNAAVMMVDVDYYVDMPRWLTAHFVPHLLYTFQPETAGKTAKEYAYSFASDQVHFQVQGGGSYRHKVWNYQKDALSVTNYFLGVFPVARASYLVERRTGGSEHEIVFLIPLRRWTIWNTWLSLIFVPEAPLLPYALKAGKHNRLTIHDDSGIHISTSLAGSTTSITIPQAVDEEILTVSRISKNDIAYPTVHQILATNEVGDSAGAKILTEYARSATPGGDNRACVPLIQHYQFTGPKFDPDAKQTLVPFMKPLALPAYAPRACVENEEHMVKGRVTSVQNDEIVLTMRMNGLLDDFVDLFIPKGIANTFAPADYDEVIARQSRPSQRRIIASTEFDDSDGVCLQGFMKKEPKPDPGDPRPIVIYEGDTKVRYSQFTYALSEYLKTQDWYAFGKTPKAIAETITNLAVNSSCCTTSDGSRWDGRVSNILRELEKRILTRFFARQFQDQVHKLHSKQFMRHVRTTFGVQYGLNYSRGSGSPETACFNSIENKFIAFIAHMSDQLAEHDASPVAAYKAKGIYGGDDGVTFDMTPELLVSAAKQVGQSYSSEYHTRADPIKFLSRSFSPKVWYGCPDSACDLDRSMRNFNSTVNLNAHVTPVMKLVEKCRAYALTDANTPYLGEFVSAVMHVAGDLDEVDIDLEPMVSWNSRMPLEVQYPNDVDFPDLSWINAPPAFNSDRFLTWVANTRQRILSRDEKLKLFLDPPYCDSREIPAVAAQEVVVGDQLLPAVPKPAPPLLDLHVPEVPPPVAPKAKAHSAHSKASNPPHVLAPQPKHPPPSANNNAVYGSDAPFVPCALCLPKGKPVKHNAANCWVGKPPDEIAKLRAEVKARRAAKVPSAARNERKKHQK